MSQLPTIRSRKLEIEYNIPISKTKKFWDGLREGKIYGTRCKKCSKLYFPPVADCGECYSSEMDWVELSGEGELITFTHIVVRPTSFLNEQPYTIAIAELREGVKALAWLTGVKRKDIKIGMKVKLAPKITGDGRVTYEFKPL
ncbi:MAG: Zn-ribbon domain-containing OB-fold protein [Aigarchaeota archaeon]|nr:Zn-ribbon domain-containing OB-fold protein [Aigarchaeota archaeon]MCX8192230.1 Zn-ribbon domain-containing OB-fold protein [Nitrososphaeria archaeon]MDW7986162.1 Zn-ribbon domain-containing OB-fold protein [Nitrososphaerota archaeon]